MSIAASLFIYFTSTVSGSFGVSVYSLGYRIYLLGLTPITSVSVALIIVVSNYYGSENTANIKKAFKFTCKFAVCLGIVLMILMQVFSTPLSLLFSFGRDCTNLLPDISLFISITTLAFPFLGMGIPSTFFFQGLSKGSYSLFWAGIREFIFSVLLTYLLGIWMNIGLTGIWLGLFIARAISSLLNLIYTNHAVNTL